MLEPEPNLKEKILNFFKGASTDYADVPKLSGAAKKYYRTYKKLFDEFSARNSEALANEKSLTSINQGNMQVSGIRYALGVTQNDIDDYVDNAYTKQNTEDHKPYSEVSQRLIEDVSSEIDVSGYSHALRDNDIRHINNSHGPNTNEKYPVTAEDIKKIPYIVQNYDKVFTKKNSQGKPGLVYVKVGQDNVIYYVEAVTTEYNKKKLLVNKQMVKTGIDYIPDLYGLVDAINKKEGSSQYLADLKKSARRTSKTLKRATL